MMSVAEYNRLIKLMDMLSSPNDGEILNTISAISRILNANGLAWSEIVLPRKLVPVRADASEAGAIQEADLSPKPFGEASNKEMYAALMASSLVSGETKRDIQRYQTAIDGNKADPSIRADLQAMYKYAILDGRAI